MGAVSDKRKRVGFVVSGNNEMGEIVEQELLIALGIPNFSYRAGAHIGSNVVGVEGTNVNVANVFD